MGIIDDVVVNAKSAAEAVGKTAGKFMDLSKLKVGAAELSAEISKKYQALGLYVYDNARELVASDAEAAGIIAELDAVKSQYESIQNEILVKQNKKVCPSCGKQSSLESVFCSVCGTKLPESPAPTVVEEPVEAEKPAPEAQQPEAPANDNTGSTEE